MSLLNISSLNLLRGSFTEKAGRANNQNDNQNAEGEDVFPRRFGKKAGAEGFGNTKDKAAEHGTGNVSDAAQYRSGERFHTRDKAHVVFDRAVIKAVKKAGSAAQDRSDEKCEGDHPI